MPTPDPQLAELADLAMDLAREMARRAKEAASNTEAVQLVAAFERTARSVRLCKLLQERLQDARSRTRREDHERRLQRRAKQVKAALSLEIDEQAGLAQAVRLHRQLTERLEHDRLFELLAQGPVEAHIARLRQRLGLPEPTGLRREASEGEAASQAHGAPPPSPLIPANAGTQAEPKPAPGEPVPEPCQPP